jgi:uncharacterized damage-inducible protein DinB
MNTIYTIFARQNQAAEKSVLEILNKLSNSEREKDRGSYFKSLSGLVRHNGGGTLYILGSLKEALGAASAAAQALSPLEKIKFPEGELSEAQWKQLASDIETLDSAYVAFARALSEAELDTQVKWFTGNPPTVPVHFMLDSLIAHSIHHRGQISQVLDELKIDNDYYGINPAFLK